MTALALPRTVRDLIDEHDAKSAAIEDAIRDYDLAFDRLGMAATVQGTFVESIGSKSYLHAASLRKNLLKSGWKAIYNRLEIDRIASAKDKQLFERTIADPPPLTIDNARATFGDYFERPRFHILRGLAEVFADQGKPAWEHAEMSAINAAHARGDDAVLDGRTYTEPERYRDAKAYATVDRGMVVRRFANGNAHVFFDKWTLLDINRALGEFYGDVLPDTPDEDAERRPGTAVAKDLQFYWSPPAVIERALEFADIHDQTEFSRSRGFEPFRVLEPSCGDGRIMDELRARGHGALGFEVDPGRAAQARAKGHSVVTGNFLDQAPTPSFDKVVMNPPFYGRHYAKHVRHALRFLKPGGTLVSILPAAAHYDHDELKGEWRDLPVASFADAGTNVPTDLIRMRSPA